MTRGLETPAASSAEHALLVACASREAEGPRWARVDACLARPLDWERVLGRARHHGMVGLLREALPLGGDPRVPAPAFAALRDELRRQAFRNLQLSAELVRLLTLLTGRGIPVIPYKGPTLAVMAYDNVALRPFGDLDLIVPRDRVRAARELLEAEGYRALYTPTADREDAYLRSQYDYGFRRDTGDVLVELHWGVAPRYFGAPFDFEATHARMGTVRLGGVAVPSPSPADLLALLCIHGARHLWERLEWVTAVAGVAARHRDLDWNGFFDRASSGGIQRIALVGLGLAQAVARVDLPDGVRARLAAECRVGQLVETFCRRLEADQPAVPGVIGAARLHLALRERWGDRLRFGVGGAFSPSERDWALPHALAPRLAALRRPWRLVREYGIGRWGTRIPEP